MIEILDKKQCCGCTACANACPKNCIVMKEDEEGFLYPEIVKSSCINCKVCEGVCPILGKRKTNEEDIQIAAVAQNRDRDICKQSTSGGIFTPIAEYVINHGGIVYGVEITEDYFVQHTGVEKKEDLVKFRNSKYVQSNLGDIYSHVKTELKNGRMVLFSGTPCQVEGLRKFLNKEYDNLILVDVVCRAVPSPGVWKKYIEMEQRERGKVQSVRFRDKALGYQYSTMELKTNDGKTYRAGIEDQPWLRMFFSGMVIRPSCSECKFRNRNRYSDFTIWDCFNIHSIEKKFNEDVGTTRILIHSEKGYNIFDKIKNKLNYRIIPSDLAVTGVQEMICSPKLNSNRNAFFQDYQNMSMNDLLLKYFPVTTKIKLKVVSRRILNVIGLDKIIKHILQKG